MAEETKTIEAVEEEKQAEEQPGVLVSIDTENLSKESIALINQIIAEKDIDKTKDLTYLFNINQNKKTMVRMDKLNELQDKLVAQFSKRISERPDEISNQELMNALKIVQDIIERGQKQVTGQNETPLIQINQQTNSVNVGEEAVGLNRESRQRVQNAILALLGDVKAEQKDSDVVDATAVEDTEND